MVTKPKYIDYIGEVKRAEDREFAMARARAAAIDKMLKAHLERVGPPIVQEVHQNSDGTWYARVLQKASTPDA